MGGTGLEWGELVWNGGWLLASTLCPPAPAAQVPPHPEHHLIPAMASNAASVCREEEEEEEDCGRWELLDPAWGLHDPKLPLS